MEPLQGAPAGQPGRPVAGSAGGTGAVAVFMSYCFGCVLEADQTRVAGLK